MRTFTITFVFFSLLLLGNVAQLSSTSTHVIKMHWQHQATTTKKNWVFLKVPTKNQTYIDEYKNCIYWKKRHLLVYFSPRAKMDGVPRLFSRCFREWDVALNNGLTYSETSNFTASDIDIAMQKKHQKADDYLGITWMDCEGECHPMRHAAIRLRWDDYNFSGTLSHELGHALGITSHSDKISDLMWPDEQGCVHPSQRDLRTLRYLYAQF